MLHATMHAKKLVPIYLLYRISEQYIRTQYSESLPVPKVLKQNCTPKISLSNFLIIMSASPTPAQWKASVACNSFTLRYMNKKNGKKGSLDSVTYTYSMVQLVNGIDAAWTFTIGSFCLVMHAELESLPLDKRTLDGYWKARILEIRAPKTKRNEIADTAVCASYLFYPGTNFLLIQKYYLQVQWFYSRNDIEIVRPKGVKELDRLYLNNSMAIHGLLMMFFFFSDFSKAQPNKSFTPRTTGISLNHQRLPVSDCVQKAKYMDSPCL